MNSVKKNYFSIANSLVLFAILFISHSVFAQTPKLLLKFAEKQNKVKSGYVKLQRVDHWSQDNRTKTQKNEGLFISTQRDLKYLVCNIRQMQNSYPTIGISCKSGHTLIEFYVWSNTVKKITGYDYYDSVEAKDGRTLAYPTANGVSLDDWENCTFQRIPPKLKKKNIRYKIIYPDEDIATDISQEWEFSRKTFQLFQKTSVFTHAGVEQIYTKVDISEQRLYEYIHPAILDTITFTFEELKKEYDRQQAEEQTKKDSIFRANLCDSIAQTITNSGAWAESIPQDVQKDTLFFMPSWKYPLLSGDTLYSDSINSQFLLIDMWHIGCSPCMKTMIELSSIDTLYDESLLKMVSINVYDKDTAIIRKVARDFNVKSDIVCAYKSDTVFGMSKQMGKCLGYPQLYLVNMKTNQVIWSSCGWYQGFTKDIEKIIKAK